MLLENKCERAGLCLQLPVKINTKGLIGSGGHLLRSHGAVLCVQVAGLCKISKVAVWSHKKAIVSFTLNFCPTILDTVPHYT
jgi:hypothetical protein